MTGEERTELVVCSLEPWDDIWRRNQYLVAGLLRRDPGLSVLFVEPPADPLYAALTRHRPRRGCGLRPLTGVPGVDDGRAWTYQPTKVLPRAIGGAVDTRLAASVIRAARRVGFTRPVLWINNPSSAALMVRSGWPALYDVTDDWLHAHRGHREHARLVANERLLMQRSAAVTVCSAALAESKGAVRNVHLVPNAVDLDRYALPQERPADLPAGPTAVYVGTVHTDRLDVDLCVAVAGRLKRGRSGAVVLVGPAPLPALERRRLVDAGVVVLGARPYQMVPAYLQHADVLLVPHLVDDFTNSLDPIKLYEYQAVGRPVVATPVAGFRENAGDAIRVADGADFVSTVADLLSRPSEPTRPPLPADVPSWNDRVVQVADVLREVAAARGAGQTRGRSP
jgi:teichuronic acid biosynthesis glycosyltransferase TuaH